MLSFHPPPLESLPTPLPALPCPTRRISWDEDASGFVLSTHIIPGAYLRSSPDAELPEPPKNDPAVSKEQRQKILEAADVRLRHMRAELDLKGLTTTGYHKVLWICLNRYVRKRLDKSRRGLTLFCAHANGLHKETWEPTLLHLLGLPAAAAVDEIWAWEIIQHGDSAILNDGKLNAMFHWIDGARDLLNFLTYYLPSSISSSPLPLHLERQSSQEVSRRMSEGFGQERTLVGIGHSIGGCLTTLAALSYPAFYSSLILIDPIIRRPPWYTAGQPNPPLEQRVQQSMGRPNSMVVSAFGRRGSWKSREEAKQQFLRSPFFQAWDPVVLDQLVAHGLFDDPSSREVKLKMPPLQEALIFAETPTGSEMSWLALPTLDERIDIRWIMPEKQLGVLGDAADALERVTRRPKNSSHVNIRGAGHLITQEAPEDLAREISAFLEKKYPDLVRRKASL